MKGVGSGFTVINYYDGSGKPLFCEEEYTRRLNEVSDEAKHKRGEFIAKCGDVDYALGIAISWFFFEFDSEKTKIFSELILRTGFFTFAQKKRVLESLIKNHSKRYPTVTDKEKKIFLQKLMNVITDRNILAHGELIIDIREEQAAITFFDASSLTSETKVLSQEFYQRLQENISFVNDYCFEHLIFP
nr:hypothetical protein [uncultured Methanoregula sp.]